MRKVLIVVAAVAAVAVLAGCGGGGPVDEEPAASSSRPPSSSSSPAPPSSRSPSPALSPEAREQVFVTFLEGKGFIPQYATAQVAVDLAGALCARYDGGASYEDVTGVLLSGGIPAFEAGGFEGAAVTAFCPEHAGKRTGEPGGA